jgi:hypothetical protein
MIHYRGAARYSPACNASPENYNMRLSKRYRDGMGKPYNSKHTSDKNNKIMVILNDYSVKTGVAISKLLGFDPFLTFISRLADG